MQANFKVNAGCNYQIALALIYKDSKSSTNISKD